MISIIIPTFNRCELLKNTIESILKHNSNFALYEIIAVDNGSTDETKNVVEEIQKRKPELTLKYFYDEIPGLLTGRHRGYKEAKGEILTFIDDDVEVSETWLDGIIECMKSRSEIALLTGPCKPKYEISPPDWLDFFWTNDQNGLHCGWLSLLDFGTEEKEIDPLFVWGLNFTIRREVFENLKGFHPDTMPKVQQYFQGDGETGLSMKAKEKGYLAVYSPKVLLNHFVPKSRLTLEYMYERSYFQGVADGYTEIRQKNGLYEVKVEKVSFQKTIKRFIKNRIFKKKNNETLYFEKIIKDKYKAGKDFINTNYHSQSKVKSWILQKNYLDIK
jgi:glycosyltransferase involved in cell wall biosynthesis